MQNDGSGRIVVQNLSKSFGPIPAVQNLSFVVEPGSVTGFLGPNGAGKTTTLRMILGLVTPTTGAATLNGLRYHQLGSPARVVGAVLENEGFHPKRTARNHLRVYAAAIGVPDQRADEVLGLVGLSSAAQRKTGDFSLGMRQRLALATALLGNPQVLVLDEPANGLDPEGILWLRNFLRAYAREGRTVLVSSHLLSEVEQTIDQVVIISNGVTRYYGSLEQLRGSQQTRVLVQAADPEALVKALREGGYNDVQPTPDGRVAVLGATRQQIGDLVAKSGLAVYGMEEDRADLEKLFFQLTNGQFSGAPAQQQYPPQPPQGGGGWGPPSGGYPQQPGYPQQGGYPQQPGMYPPQQGGYPGHQAASPYQPPPGGYPQQGPHQGWGGQS